MDGKTVALDHKRRINFSELMRSGCSGARRLAGVQLHDLA
jgi:hypothetical protein